MKILDWQKWRIIAKLDPDKNLPEERLVRLAKSKKLDAIVVGGTQGITYNNTYTLLQGIKEAGYTGPVIQEVSSIDSISLEPDMHFIPIVLNASSLQWIRDAHIKAIHRGGALIEWDRIVVEGYLVLNQDSSVARLTKAQKVSDSEALAYLSYAENILGLANFYIEYSGVFGDMKLVEKMSRARARIHLTYGGGIKNAVQVEQLLKYVNTVVIGNALYDDEAVWEEIFY